EEPGLRDSLSRIEIEQENRFEVCHERYRSSESQDHGCNREAPQRLPAKIVEYSSTKQKLARKEAEARFRSRSLSRVGDYSLLPRAERVDGSSAIVRQHVFPVGPLSHKSF